MARRSHKIMLIGFGTVARGLCQLLHDHRGRLAAEQGFEFEIVAVATATRGIMYNPAGLDLAELLQLAATRTPFTRHLINGSVEQLIRKRVADIIIELTPTNPQTAEPAYSTCRTALENKQHVVLGNKGPVALHLSELKTLAQQNGRQLLYEATVLSGTPVFSLLRSTLAGTRISRVRGILNGTTNFMLTEMAAGADYEQALASAGERGYLEADLLADVDGHDAQIKLAILANTLFPGQITLQDIQRQGIREITPEHIRTAARENQRWKLVADLQLSDGQVQASVKPQKLPLTDSLAQVEGTENALTFTTDLLGDISISGPGAGSLATGYGILSDLLTLNTGHLS